MEKETIDKILFNFLETSYLFEKSEEKMFNLSWQEIYLLQCLRNREPVIMSELGNILKLEKYQTTRVVKRLEEKEMLIREKSRDDGRLMFVSISQNGISKLDEIENYHFDLFKNNISSISDKELNALNKAIHEFAGLTGVKK